jgi:hypothetical protein
MQLFYTYLWLRENGLPYYVGKARTLKRAYRRGSPPKERVILQEWETEREAFEAERFLIALFGRKDLGTGCLRNLTDGGEGTSGSKHSLQSRLKMKKPKSAETRRKMSLAAMGNKKGVGKKMSAETKAKLIEINKNRIRSPQELDRLRTLRRNQPPCPKAIEAMRRANIGNRYAVGSKGNLGYKHTEESRAKMRGRKFSEEHRRKLSLAHLGQTPWNKRVVTIP